MKVVTLTAAAALVAGSMAVSMPAQAGKCVKASASAAMVVAPIAAELAKISLASSISAKGMKGKGKVWVKCKYEFVFSSCTASQRACK